MNFDDELKNEIEIDYQEDVNPYWVSKFYNVLRELEDHFENKLETEEEEEEEEETDENDDAESIKELVVDEPSEELVIDEPNEELVVDDEVPKLSLRSVIKQRAEERHNRRLEKINIIKDQIESLKLRIASFQ